MQIQYNTTRIEEWCNKNEIAEAALHLEPLMQAAKLLQLNKTSVEDVDIMFDVCFLLTPSQIKKLLTLYHVSEFENPISSTILRALADRCVEDTEQSILFETNKDPPFICPPPHSIAHLHRHFPHHFISKLPLLHVIAEM